MSVTVAALILAQASATGTEPPRVQIHGWVDAFYGQCLKFNRPSLRSKYPGRRSGAVDREWSRPG